MSEVRLNNLERPCSWEFEFRIHHFGAGDEDLSFRALG